MKTHRVIATGELVTIQRWVRPYGVRYGHADDGREFHISQLTEYDEQEDEPECLCCGSLMVNGRCSSTSCGG